MFHRKVSEFMSASFIARLIGIIRDSFFAKTFGASYIADIFFLSFRIPHMLRTFVADGAVYGALTPELSYRKHHDHNTNTLLSQFFFAMSFILCIMTFTFSLFAPQLVKVIASGFTQEKQAIIVDLLRILLPWTLFYSLNTIFIACQNAVNRFWVMPTASIIRDTSIIASTLIFLDNIYYLSYGVTLSGFIQLIFVYFLSKSSGFKIHSVNPLKIFNKDIKKLFKKMFQTSMATLGMYINSMINVFLASYLPEGHFTYVICAEQINLLLIDLLATSISNVLLPFFSKIRDNSQKALEALKKSIVISIQFVSPIIIIVFFNSEFLTKLFFCYGKFNINDCMKTAAAFRYDSLALPAICLVRLLNNFCFSQHKQSIAIYASIVSIVTNLCFNLSLLPKIGYLGMSVTMSLSMWSVIIFYFYYFKIYLKISKLLIWILIHIVFAKFLSGFLTSESIFIGLLQFLSIGTLILTSYFFFGKHWNILISTKSLMHEKAK